MVDAIKPQNADYMDITAVAAITGGQVLQLPDGRAAIVPVDLAAGAVGAAGVSGVWTVTKAADIVWTDGMEIWWDHSANAATGEMVAAADKDFYLGTAVGDVAAATTTGRVNLNVKPNYLIDLQTGNFDTVIVKTVVGSTTVEVPHIEMQGGTSSMIFGATAEAQKLDLLSVRSFAVESNWIVDGIVNVIDDGDATAIDFNIGVANGTHATDHDSITERCGLHLNGNALDLFAMSADGTTTVAETDTTVNIALGTPFYFLIDGRNTSDIQIYVNHVLMLGSTVFKLNAATGPLKLLAHLEKTSDDTTAKYNIAKLRVRLSGNE